MFIQHSTRRRQRRVGAACIALVQVGVFAVLSSADALLDAERFGSPVHVESPENRACTAHHSHLFCQVVRLLLSGTPASRVAASDSPAPDFLTTDRPRGDAPAKIANFLIGAISPRGPPLA